MYQGWDSYFGPKSPPPPKSRPNFQCAAACCGMLQLLVLGSVHVLREQVSVSQWPVVTPLAVVWMAYGPWGATTSRLGRKMDRSKSRGVNGFQGTSRSRDKTKLTIGKVGPFWVHNRLGPRTPPPPPHTPISTALAVGSTVDKPHRAACPCRASKSRNCGEAPTDPVLPSGRVHLRQTVRSDWPQLHQEPAGTP